MCSSAQQQVELLFALIADLEDDGVINRGQENSLIKKLVYFSMPHAESKVEAFINQVNAFVNAGDIYRRTRRATTRFGRVHPRKRAVALRWS
jgi:hypothetical protein